MITHLLTELLKHDNFQWGSDAKAAFSNLKKAITLAHVLKLQDFSCLFVLETDVSGESMSAILSQDNYSITFFSKKLTRCMKNQSAYVRKFFPITEAVAKFQHYLFGYHFIIRIDQQPLKHLCSQTIHTTKQ